MTETDSADWRGVFAIPCTPFTDTGALDLASLRSQIDFCVAAGAHGIVAPVNASEAWTLSDEERRTVAEVLVETVAGRIPVVIGVSGGSAEVMIAFARHAAAIGADAVIAQPPSGPPGSLAAIEAAFRRLSGATPLPIVLQNIDPPFGTRLAPDVVAGLVRQIPRLDWVKEETAPSGQAISAELALAGPAMRGVMGGMAGRYLLDEYRRGACGTMPACEAADVHVQIWDALEAGDERRARDVFNRLLPLLNLEARSLGVVKAVLVRRGVIATDYMRQHAGNPLDDDDRRELDVTLADLRDLFRLALP